MGIFKTLANGIGSLADGPAPEILGLVSGMSTLISLALSFETKPMVEEKSVYTIDKDGDTIEETIPATPKTNPIGVLMSFVPGHRDFSIRKGVKGYKELDVEGKLIFKASAFAMSTGLISQLLHYSRMLNYEYDLSLARNERDILNSKHKCLIGRFDSMAENLDGIVEWYDQDHERFNSGQGDYRNYTNCKNIAYDLRSAIKMYA